MLMPLVLTVRQGLQLLLRTRFRLLSDLNASESFLLDMAQKSRIESSYFRSTVKSRSQTTCIPFKWNIGSEVVLITPENSMYFLCFSKLRIC